MKLQKPFRVVGEHLEISLAGGRAVFTTRRGGYSRGPYESLNLGRWTDDDPDAVNRNRTLVEAHLGVRLAYGRQVHGAHVAVAQRLESDESGPMQADGQVTATRGLAPMVLTADCLPIAIGAGRAVAMLHAGWRGLAAGVIPAGVNALRELGSRGALVAAIGPGAGGCCYEVGDEVHEALGSELGPPRRHGNNLDLKAIARNQLDQAGIGEVHDIGLCTICGDPALFFSHRRDRGVTGRQAGIAWLS